MRKNTKLAERRRYSRSQNLIVLNYLKQQTPEYMDDGVHFIEKYLHARPSAKPVYIYYLDKYHQMYRWRYDGAQHAETRRKALRLSLLGVNVEQWGWIRQSEAAYLGQIALRHISPALYGDIFSSAAGIAVTDFTGEVTCLSRDRAVNLINTFYKLRVRKGILL